MLKVTASKIFYSFFLLSMLLVGCEGGTNNYSSDDYSSNRQTPVEEPSFPCPYDVIAARDEIYRTANIALTTDPLRGKIHQIANIRQAVFKAERISGDPRCTEDIQEIGGIDNAIAYGTQAADSAEKTMNKLLDNVNRAAERAIENLGSH